jgi:hypothetical protein
MVIRTLGFPATLIRLFGFSFLEYWYWYSCRCGMIALMVACVHVALTLQLKLKKGKTTIDIYRFMVCYLCHYLLAGFRKIQDCVMEEEEFEGLED